MAPQTPPGTASVHFSAISFPFNTSHSFVCRLSFLCSSAATYSLNYDFNCQLTIAMI